MGLFHWTDKVVFADDKTDKWNRGYIDGINLQDKTVTLIGVEHGESRRTLIAFDKIVSLLSHEPVIPFKANANIHARDAEIHVVNRRENRSMWIVKMSKMEERRNAREKRGEREGLCTNNWMPALSVKQREKKLNYMKLTHVRMAVSHTQSCIDQLLKKLGKKLSEQHDKLSYLE